MKRNIAAIHLIIAMGIVAMPAASQRIENVIGLEHVGPPRGMKVIYAKILTESATLSDSFGVTILEGEKNHEIAVWLEKYVRQEEKKARWKVVDAVGVPALRKGEVLAELCRPKNVEPILWDGSRSDFLFGIAEFGADQCETKKIRRAWKINMDSKRIERAEVSGVLCFNEKCSD